MDKWLRKYKLYIQTEDDGTLVEIEFPVTLEFHVRREILSSAGTATFRIYNLNQTNRNKILKPYNNYRIRSIKLEAGYGDAMSVIFNGFIQESKSFRSEGQTNFITEITAYDYAPGIQTLQSNWNFDAPNNTYEYLINKIVKEDLGCQVGSMGSFTGVCPLKKGVFAKPAWEALKEVVGDGNCYFDNGKVYCLKDDDVFVGSIVDVDSSSGLLGSPRINGAWIIFDMVFEPGLQNGQRLRLNSRTLPTFNGDYKIIGIEHSGVISGAVSGKLKTSVNLMLGTAGKDNPFTEVEAV